MSATQSGESLRGESDYKRTTERTNTQKAVIASRVETKGELLVGTHALSVLVIVGARYCRGHTTVKTKAVGMKTKSGAVLNSYSSPTRPSFITCSDE